MILPILPLTRIGPGTERRSVIDVPIEFRVKFNEYKAVAGIVLGKMRALSRVRERGPDDIVGENGGGKGSGSWTSADPGSGIGSSSSSDREGRPVL